ncbi:hypothetical protein HK102_001069 [Quaeritorhiza haematococci]|nr:hypothetical protein HK102_001069 [Quaeritorhiza haematococci]
MNIFGWWTKKKDQDRTESETSSTPPLYRDAESAAALSLCRMPEGASTLSRERVADRIRGLLVGQALGDAIGLATEFMNKNRIKSVYKDGPIQFGPREAAENIGVPILQDGHRSRFAKGAWTDDTDQALLILATIFETYISGEVSQPNEQSSPAKSTFAQPPTLYPPSFAIKLKRWAKNGIPELEKPPRGIGYTVGCTLSHKDFGLDPHKAAEAIQAANNHNLASNGAVMRTAVAGVPFFHDRDIMEKNTLNMALCTHADDRCGVSSLVVNSVVAHMLRGGSMKEESWDALMKDLFDRYSGRVRDKAELERYIFPPATLQELELDDSTSIGYTYKAMSSALWCLRALIREVGEEEDDEEKRQRVWKRVLMQLVMEGGDADTNGSVAGALMGCYAGLSGLPSDWIEGLRDSDWLLEKSQVLAAIVCGDVSEQ